MGEPSIEDPDVVRGRFGGLVSAKVMVAMCALYVVGGVAGRNWGLLAAGVLYIVALGVLGLRRSTRIDANGISPASWKWSVRQIGWSAVTEVLRTGYSDQVISVRLSSGEVLRLVDIPSDRAAKVARIGDKPLVAPPAPEYTPVAAVPRRPTEAETERELRRRADRLAADRARLQGQLDRRVRP